jgi:tetratricopeptide (TPR) repeat protein
MNVEDGALLLLRRATIILEQTSRIATSEATFLQAEKIAQELQSYPLALDLAGAYIKETGRSLPSYLKRYRQQQWWTRLLGRQGWFTTDYLDLIANTLTLTFKKIAQVNPNALELLRFFTFLHSDALSYEMILYGASTLTGSLHTITTDRLVLDNALAVLQRFSLIHQHADSTTLYMHSVVQLVIRRKLTQRRQQQLAKQAVSLVHCIFPEVCFKNWEKCERYLPQAQHCSVLIDNFHLTLEEGGLLLERLGFYYYQRGCYIEANIYLTQALRLQEQHYPDNPLDTAQTLNSLGLLSQRQGRYQDAKVLHQRALELRESVSDDAQIAESLHNLAVLYEHEGHYQDAKQYYLRAHALNERVLGPDDPDTGRTLNNLALIYYLQGYYLKAEATYQRVLTIYERSLPPDHPDLAYPLNGLGTLAEKRGNDTQAAELYQRALAIREQALGKEHSETVRSINRLARIHELQSDYSQAKDIYQQALAIAERNLGPEHTDVALILNNMAFLVYKQGQYRQAEQLYQRALSIYELTPGEERPAFAQALNNLGQLYHKMNNEARAEALLRQALVIREQVLGMTHPDTAQSLSNLGTLLADQQRYKEAEPFFQRALDILLQTVGSAYPEVAIVREKYASLLERMKRNEEATRLRQAISEQEEQRPTEPPQNNQ